MFGFQVSQAMNPLIHLLEMHRNPNGFKPTLPENPRIAYQSPKRVVDTTYSQYTLRPVQTGPLNKHMSTLEITNDPPCEKCGVYHG